MIQRILQAWRTLSRWERRALVLFFAIDASFVTVTVASWVRADRTAAIVWLLGTVFNVWQTHTIARKWLREAEAVSSARSRYVRADEIALRLGARLHAVATERHIPIRYVADAEMGKAAATYGHSVVSDAWGRKRRVAREIRLNREWLSAPERGLREWKCLTLAHEIGHHIAIHRAGDHSEEAADREAMRLVRSLLADDEREVVEPFLVAVEQAQAVERCP